MANKRAGRRPQKRTARGARKQDQVAEPRPSPYASAIATARVFQSGNSQAVRLPKEFRFKSQEVQIYRRGDEVVLRERPATLSARWVDLPPLPDDALPDRIPDRPPDPVEDF